MRAVAVGNILHLRMEGHSGRAIARQLNLPRESVNRLLRQHGLTKRSGNPHGHPTQHDGEARLAEPLPWEWQPQVHSYHSIGCGLAGVIAMGDEE